MIYSMHPDINNYLCFNISGDAARKALGDDTVFHFDESPIRYSDNWSPMELEFYNASGSKDLPIPDICQHHGRLWLSEKAYAALNSHISADGEFLPVFEKNQSGYLFNTLSLEDHALDNKLCQKNQWGEITWLAFDEAKVRSALFRTEYDDYMGTFCTDKLLLAYREAGLTGLIFSENLAPEPA